MTAADPAPPDNGAPPSLARRMAAFVYEGILLFGVLVMAAYLYGTLTQQRHALQGQAGLQAFLFVVLAIYFVWFWSHGGQTVALRAWHIRLVTHDGRPVTQRRALLRYLASWIWFLPALASARVIGLDSPGPIFALLTAGVLVYALLARARRDGQFWHDAWCGTRLVTWRVPVRRAQSGA